MKFRIRVRAENVPTIINTHDFEDFMVSHTDIMEATGGNPFYERGIVMYDSADDRVVQYIRITEDK